MLRKRVQVYTWHQAHVHDVEYIRSDAVDSAVSKMSRCL